MCDYLMPAGAMELRRSLDTLGMVGIAGGLGLTLAAGILIGPASRRFLSVPALVLLAITFSRPPGGTGPSIFALLACLAMVQTVYVPAGRRHVDLPMILGTALWALTEIAALVLIPQPPC